MSQLTRPLEDLAEQTQDVLNRVSSLTREDLSHIVDALTSLVTGADDGPKGRIRVPLPLVQVAQVRDRWAVTVVGDQGAEVVARKATKIEAVETGRREASARMGSLLVHRADGSLMETYHYGDAPDAEHVQAASSWVPVGGMVEVA